LVAQAFVADNIDTPPDCPAAETIERVDPVDIDTFPDRSDRIPADYCTYMVSPRAKDIK